MRETDKEFKAFGKKEVREIRLKLCEWVFAPQCTMSSLKGRAVAANIIEAIMENFD